MSYCSRYRWRRFTVLDLTSWAFTAIFSNICTAHAQKRLFMNFRCKIYTPPFDSQTPISYLSAKFWRFGDVFRWFLFFICWTSAIFLLPVCLTYWPRKYTTHVDPHVDNSHQVWSWYDHTLPSYSILVCRYGTWPCDLVLWPFNLEQLSYMAGHVTNLAIKYEDRTPIRSWVMS